MTRPQVFAVARPRLRQHATDDPRAARPVARQAAPADPQAPRGSRPFVEREREQLHLVCNRALEPVGQVVRADVANERGELGTASTGTGRPASIIRRAYARQAEIEQTQAKLDELAELWADGTIGRSEWLKARAPLEKRQTLAKKRLAALNRTTALEPHLGDVAGLREHWADMNLTRQQQIVAALLDHLVVGPGRRGYNRFDPTRLEPVWRI